MRRERVKGAFIFAGPYGQTYVSVLSAQVRWKYSPKQAQ